MTQSDTPLPSSFPLEIGDVEVTTETVQIVALTRQALSDYDRSFSLWYGRNREASEADREQFRGLLEKIAPFALRLLLLDRDHLHMVKSAWIARANLDVPNRDPVAGRVLPELLAKEIIEAENRYKAAFNDGETSGAWRAMDDLEASYRASGDFEAALVEVRAKWNYHLHDYNLGDSSPLADSGLGTD